MGVTGLSRAGKTCFIIGLGPQSDPWRATATVSRRRKSGHVARAFLEQQPDDAVPRFQYEDHNRRPVNDRAWPDRRAPFRNCG
ncbi:YcjX family protein [Mesorhizobium newzealandense]|uniref:YcjX family protein n=1 Tax=Mesorhizobium newzealandense TaxID=1300302 RepID=A0ABW4U6P0_9HYPH